MENKGPILFVVALICFVFGLILFNQLGLLDIAPRIGGASNQASTEPACASWLVRDVIESSPAPGMGRIVFERQGKVYGHNFHTVLAVGDEVLVRIDFDCAGRWLTTTAVGQ